MCVRAMAVCARVSVCEGGREFVLGGHRESGEGLGFSIRIGPFPPALSVAEGVLGAHVVKNGTGHHCVEKLRKSSCVRNNRTCE